MDTRLVVEVFTNKSKDFVLEHGGSASWVMSAESVERVKYCVCCRNDEAARDDDDGARGEARNEAFLVGKVSGFEVVEHRNGRNRYLLKFSEYAEVSVPAFRHGSIRNPVVYSDVASCRGRGLDISSLDFKPMPKATRSYVRASREERGPGASGAGLSISEAKQGVALRYGVPVDAVTITVTG